MRWVFFLRLMKLFSLHQPNTLWWLELSLPTSTITFARRSRMLPSIEIQLFSFLLGNDGSLYSSLFLPSLIIVWLRSLKRGSVPILIILFDIRGTFELFLFIRIIIRVIKIFWGHLSSLRRVFLLFLSWLPSLFFHERLNSWVFVLIIQNHRSSRLHNFL